MARGLLFYHWSIRLGKEDDHYTSLVIGEGDRCLSVFFGMTGNYTKDTIGGGALSYEALQSAECPQISIWRLQLYGVATFSDYDGTQSNAIWTFTGSSEQVQGMAEALS